jgi:hypothetical protein
MHHEKESEREKSGGTVYKERVERTEQKQKNERENQWRERNENKMERDNRIKKIKVENGRALKECKQQR